MKFKSPLESLIVEIICLLFALLFVYAAVSKILDFENFQIQLGQSPILSVYASWISWLVPIAELLLAFILSVPRFRSLGLLAALNLMTMFTVYIFIILYYSAFVPCSCGGILEKMTWKTHLVFNIVFVILAAVALQLDFMERFKKSFDISKFGALKRIAISVIFSTIIIVSLFLSSEYMIQHENPFIRLYPKHPIQLRTSIDLKSNAYYFAGSNRDRIYLGNYSAPLHLLSINSKLQEQQKEKIIFEAKNIPFKRVTIKVKPPYFYLMDGSVPAVFRGKIDNWKIIKEFNGIPYYTIAEPIDSVSVIFRSNSGTGGANVFGHYKAGSYPKIFYNPTLLKQQIDGIFDTDGMVVYSEGLKRMVYVYYYRNEFTVIDNHVTLDFRGHTIDTNTVAKIKVTNLKNKTIKKMSSPPLLVNAHTALCGNLLFVHSKIPGRFEDKKLWKQANIIDVYDLNKKAYVMSFALYKISDKKLRSFFVTTTNLYALMDKELIVYTLGNNLKNEIKMGKE
ncbi:MauE/DoxX family redox-associated membrane protein [Flavobacterium sp. TAB 87]|uniref:MauE/DoxX family redox-associated membrane protein n=1 Tax=Flavobacterium sp. TAB 87 TaxID=1729581 RepID=UPI00076C2852|nr:MauE/DoxX family redox-associated membrane protein [Flavobacterium sp. TAB 87]KVV16225.1 hypothetical protein AP058_00214 [Flavobacterium sp. TAB 87]